MLCGSSGSRLQYLLSWWQMCIFQQCWLQILKYQLEMPSEIISHLNILVFLVTHSHVWYPKLCWDLLRALSKEHRVQSPAPAGYCITQAAKSGTLSCVCCCSQQRHHNRQRQHRMGDLLGSWTTLQKNPSFSPRVQREESTSWQAGMGEDGQGQSSQWDASAGGHNGGLI